MASRPSEVKQFTDESVYTYKYRQNRVLLSKKDIAANEHFCHVSLSIWLVYDLIPVVGHFDCEHY